MKNISLLFLFCSTLLYSQDTIKLKLYREKVNNIVTIYADNDELAPVSVEFSFTADNMSSSLADKSVVVIPAQSKKFALSDIKTVDRTRPTKFAYDAYYVLGDVNTGATDEHFVYTLPFEITKKHSIYQGYNGKFSHQDASSLDFSLQTGDKVFSARGGKVVTVVTNNNRNCMTKECANFNNKIIILHSDGTFAEYVHLRQNGSVVKVGDEVGQGQHIGFSGNTGWSKGPHLHFSVFIPKMDGGRRYFKTKFNAAGSKVPVYLSEGKTYGRSL